MKNRYLLIALLLISTCSFAQENPPGEYIYFTTGTILKGKLESADDEKIITTLENGARWPGQRDKFMIFFNKSGNYLTEKALSKDPEISKRQIQALYNDQTDNKGYYDVIFKAIPREVIRGTVKNVLDGAINYVTTEGKSASVNSDNVFAYIKRNGAVELFKDARDISEVAENLTNMEADFLKLRPLTPSNNTAAQPSQVLRPTARPNPVAQAAATKPETKPENVPEPKPETAQRKKLTAEEQKIYQAKSIDKMEELSSLLNDIVDAGRSRTEKNMAIKKALKMFVKGAKVEVSAINNTNNKSNRAVEEYLERLSRLSYSKVKVTYAELNFVEDFAPDDQGNFWGMASYVQTFETNSFRDLTPKRQKIKLQQYEKIVDGTSEEKFEILLGNISINVSQ